MSHSSKGMFNIRNIIKTLRKHIYIHIGWDGFMFALEFNFRGYAYDIEINTIWMRMKIDEW